MNTTNLRKLLDAATARPWVQGEPSEHVAIVEKEADAELIVELVNNADELLAENERLRAERQELIDSVAAIRQQQKEKEWPVTGGLVTALEQKP